MKLGIIRCMQTENYCPGNRDFKAIRERKGAFSDVDDIELVDFINCGGCPGKKAVLRAKSLVSQGADTIAFASCIQKGTLIGYPYPFAKRMKDLVQNAVGDQKHEKRSLSPAGEHIDKGLGAFLTTGPTTHRPVLHGTSMDKEGQR